jgi:DNA invertase Pin-like site-specific DNA recombinase
MMIGYARVSTGGQDLDQQRAALKAAGCKRIYEEKASGAKRSRPELAKMLDSLRAGDVVTMIRLDRLARSTRDLLDIAERLDAAEAGLKSLAEPWADTTSPAGRMVLTFFAGVAEFERSLIHERTSAGRVVAKAKGVRFGRPPALSVEQIAHARQLIKDDTKPAEVARLLGVHRATLYRALGSTTEHPR